MGIKQLTNNKTTISDKANHTETCLCRRNGIFDIGGGINGMTTTIIETKQKKIIVPYKFYAFILVTFDTKSWEYRMCIGVVTEQT